MAGRSRRVSAWAVGAVLATASWDHTAKLRDVTDLRQPVELSTLGTHTDDINDVAFSPDGRMLVTASTDRTAKLWDVTIPRAPRELATLAGHTDSVVTAAFRPGGTMLATGGYDRKIRLLGSRQPHDFVGLG